MLKIRIHYRDIVTLCQREAFQHRCGKSFFGLSVLHPDMGIFRHDSFDRIYRIIRGIIHEDHFVSVAVGVHDEISGAVDIACIV